MDGLVDAPDKSESPIPRREVAAAASAPADAPWWPSWSLPVPSRRTIVLTTAAVAVGLVMLAAVAPPPVPFLVLALLAAVGLFTLLAAPLLATRLPLAQLWTGRPGDSLADAWPDGVLLATGDGRAVYTNAAYDALVPPAPGGGLRALELWLTGQPAASEALFRLVRAGARGAAATAEIDIRDPRHPDGRRTVRVAVAPLTPSGSDRPPVEGDATTSALLSWRLTDVTAEHRLRRSSERHDRMRLAAYDGAPAGLVILDSGGRIVHMNGTIEQWLGLAEATGGEDAAALEAVFLGAGADILRRHLERYPQSSFQCSLDMSARGGRRLPVRVFAGPPTGEDGMPADGRVLTVVRAAWADPVAAGFGAGSERAFESHYRAAPFGIATITADGIVASANSAFAAMVLDGTGGLGEPAVDVLCRAASQEARTAVDDLLARVRAGEAGLPPVDTSADTAGRLARRLYAVPLAPTAGRRDAAILYVVDTSEQRELEAKFAQSQKLEAIGKLAGEMAHNFNNVLTAIIGSADLMLQTFRVSDPAHKDIDNIRQSAFRAAELVNQLMSFSRQQTQRLEYAHLGEWLTELRPMVKTSLGEKIELSISADRDLWLVRADRTQVQQVLMNFASNARDAMAGGGDFRLHTRNVTEREVLRLAQAGMTVAEYVVIEATDTGSGIPADVMTRMFEPFFTTKDIGKGTGLGLASVYGIVKQLSGYVLADSTLGQGTTFRVYLPRAHPEPEAELAPLPKAPAAAPRPVDLTGSATVLVVEDEDMVRSVAVRQLVRLGYRVLEASNGYEALGVIEAERGAVDLVVSDVVMPEMDGPSLLKAIRVSYPELRIIFVSGHTNEAFRATIGQDETTAFLQKPFSLPDLALKVKQELAR